MAEENRRDLKMIGETSTAGGIFRNIKVTGETVFNGDVDCVKLSHIGELEIKGGLRAEELKITGECDVQGGLAVGAVSGRGELKAESGARIEKIKFTGNIEVSGDCETGTLELNGAFNIPGLLSSERMEVQMFGSCKAAEIGGSNLRVRRSRKSKLLHLFKPGGPIELTADLIEGDTVDLEYTIAEVVRGNRVTIGPGCRIGRVEYRGDYTAHKSASVKESVRQ
ncbi:hypothetical protein [Cohnella terricola]|uniref:Polymer-forming cytoskeletal protein n=1 Tax=Cohnella terricola TaxID=1289167 RepID=A0A559JFH0_9BACL|nr:hypothetical protein [Cohnella terricola]TVX98618.1 hypothetical protein FPZ45_15005 [Cohnella terricola]